MPIEITTIKNLDESDCYSSRNTNSYMTLLLGFLKNHPDHAFTPKEIKEGLMESGTKFNPRGIKIQDNSISNALYVIKTKKLSKNLKFKGNYYWYEENK